MSSSNGLRVVNTLLLLGLLGGVAYLIFRKKKTDGLKTPEEAVKQAVKDAEKKPEKVLQITPKEKLKLKDQIVKIQENIKNSGGKKAILTEDDTIVIKKAIEHQLITPKPVYTGGGSGGGSQIPETNINKNIAPQRVLTKHEVPFNKPSNVLAELI
jgi:hypothetical protein